MRHDRLLIDLLVCFLSSHLALQRSISPATKPATRITLPLIPISNFLNEFTLVEGQDTAINSTSRTLSVFDENGCYCAEDGIVYQLGLAEEKDLPNVARFVVSTFGAEVIRVSQAAWSSTSIERMLLQPAVDAVNGYSALVAFAEVLAGLRQRLSGRLHLDKQQTPQSPSTQTIGLSPPPRLEGTPAADQVKAAASYAIVLVLGRTKEPLAIQASSGEWQDMDVIGTVELQLQVCDAKIPFSLPWLDALERRLAKTFGIGRDSHQNDILQPYLSNLAVDETIRGKGIGRALVQCVESIAATRWKASRLYLHVDPDNEAAVKLYASLGYKDAGFRWRPFWAGNSANISYYVKKLNH
ncbi:hypothetical protein MPSEU_000126600 [Mayamaea pseudoterrestris]|nr:hypothetical protein MPSEU_000125300 [Mayamaea pseudoterrestris]GKY91547.1 hypothetical protein MPSEU_000126600 [Mayamaea pseudoterrestris]